jgi:hypothetical protein
MKQSIEELLRQEFGCYYDPDLLEMDWKNYLSIMASDSANRIGYQIEYKDDLQNLIKLLQEARNDSEHQVIEMICDQMLIDLIDEPEDLHIIQELIDMMISNFQKDSKFSLVTSE